MTDHIHTRLMVALLVAIGFTYVPGDTMSRVRAVANVVSLGLLAVLMYAETRDAWTELRKRRPRELIGPTMYYITATAPGAWLLAATGLTWWLAVPLAFAWIVVVAVARVAIDTAVTVWRETRA